MDQYKNIPKEILAAVTDHITAAEATNRQFDVADRSARHLMELEKEFAVFRSIGRNRRLAAAKTPEDVEAVEAEFTATKHRVDLARQLSVREHERLDELRKTEGKIVDHLRQQLNQAFAQIERAARDTRYSQNYWSAWNDLSRARNTGQAEPALCNLEKMFADLGGLRRRLAFA